MNQHLIRTGNISYPSIYKSGIRYTREKKDVWKPITEVYKTGIGDCEDLAASRVAILREQEGDPRARVGVYQSGPQKFHAIVIHGDGRREDPSKKLGMGSNMKRKRRKLKLFQRCPIPGKPGAWVGVGEDSQPSNQSITFDLYRSGKGFSGIVRLPTNQPGVAILAKTTPTNGAPSAKAAKQATAAKSIRLAAKLATNPAIQAMMPPGTALAVKALQTPLGKLATGGTVKALRKLF